MNPDYGWGTKDEDDRTVRFSVDRRDVEATGSIQKARDPQYDPATGTVKPVGSLGPWQAAIIFITNEVGIGILSLPAALNVLGLIPGIISIIGMGTLSLYTAYILVQFYRRYPHVVNIVDYGRIIGGKPLEVIFAIGFIINLSLISASAVITMSIGINTISEHAACTVIWIGIACLACYLLCLPRTMMFVSHCGWPCTVSIVAAVIIPMAALGVSGPANAPPGSSIAIKLVGNPTFSEAVSSFLNIGFAFTGNQAFVTVLVEMRDPARDFTKAILIEKPFAIAIYTTVAIACYCLAGEYITSPAIGAAPVTTAKISYGIIFISLLGTGLVFGHTSIKYLFVVVMRHLSFFERRSSPLRKRSRGVRGGNRKPSVEADMMRRRQSQPHDSRSVVSWIAWIAIATAFWILVFVIANAIPVFNSLLNISSSILLAWFTWGFPVVFWFHLNWKKMFSTWKKTVLVVLNVFILAIVVFMNTAGMYASVDGLLTIFADPDGEVNGPFTCADNSIF
ncbi:uncharacterized protein HMPREF1541_10644 [Cyphellophora europaea CBS 101466]|uniref:Amino acid transporter transmembrane domain-containing protein n=1 Tax=Cyphellophora europaea (strain CBS 101466) TaxID=1220924 RepID=W2S839_CYPE1|nr:uncharacterized protein HMPREF1541_10644 [Cyphellophora europaea CBS 101466]ETN44094.1 hypothetical protein HMPREF1541_10644 [Cyphellophora europaea CBS 101466]